MQVELAEISLLGARDENQDRVAGIMGPGVALIAAIDGMGGHADGARAAETARRVLLERFAAVTPQPLIDPLAFLHIGLGHAHEEVVKLGLALPLEQRPRATCAVCLVQDDTAWWAHVGDSRVYHLRDGAVLTRTRDHSHVELLLQEGLISPEQAQNHPMRNYVDSCLGGDPLLPEMLIGRCVRVRPGDTLLVCTDGFWANLRDEDIAGSFYSGANLRTALLSLADFSVRTAGKGSDNTSAVALRIL